MSLRAARCLVTGRRIASRVPPAAHKAVPARKIVLLRASRQPDQVLDNAEAPGAEQAMGGTFDLLDYLDAIASSPERSRRMVPTASGSRPVPSGI